MTPAPGIAHQRVAAELFVILREYVREHGLGEILWDVDVLFVSGQFLRPDMVFVPPDAELSDRGVESPTTLVVEVLSPHSKRIDRVKKPPRYRDFGVPEYWVVDPEHRRIRAPPPGGGCRAGALRGRAALAAVARRAGARAERSRRVRGSRLRLVEGRPFRSSVHLPECLPRRLRSVGTARCGAMPVSAMKNAMMSARCVRCCAAGRAGDAPRPGGSERRPGARQPPPDGVRRHPRGGGRRLRDAYGGPLSRTPAALRRLLGFKVRHSCRP